VARNIYDENAAVHVENFVARNSYDENAAVDVENLWPGTVMTKMLRYM
jgi:hypothetical protein